MVDGSVETFPENAGRLMSRRGFIGGLIATGAAVLLCRIVTEEPSHATEASIDIARTNQAPEVRPLQEQQPPVDNQRSEVSEDEEIDRSGGYASSALLGAANAAGAMAARPVFNALGVRVGNSSVISGSQTKQEKVQALERIANLPRRKVFGAILSVVITYPAIEEGIFRAAPSAAANFLGVEGTNWALGAGTSAAFASIHGFKTKTGETMLPLPQFTLGMITWWLQRNRGYSHALLAHSVNNLPLGILVGRVYQKARRENPNDS